MIVDMKAEDIAADYKEITLTLYGGITRRVLYTEIETPIQTAN